MNEQGYLHTRSSDFGKVPHELIADTTITSGAVRLYAHMHWRYGSTCNNFEARDTMAGVLGVTDRTITNYTAELEQADWIVIIPRSSDRGRESNFYHVFELQSDCRKWRAEHNTPKPDRSTDPRKLRIGIGGSPTHKNDDDQGGKLSSDTQTPLNSSSGTPLNSSSQYPDSRTIQTHDHEEVSNDTSLNILVEQPKHHACKTSTSQPETPAKIEKKFEVGKIVFVWSDKRRKFIDCEITKVTAKQVHLTPSDTGAFEKDSIRRYKSSTRWEVPKLKTFDDFPPEVQAVLYHVRNVQPGEGVPGETVAYANTILSMLKDRYAPVDMVPTAHELDRVFLWAKEEDKYFANGSYDKPEKIANFVNKYRLEFGNPGDYNPNDYVPLLNDDEIIPIDYDEPTLCRISRIDRFGPNTWGIFWTERQLRDDFGYGENELEEEYIREVLDSQREHIVSENFQAFLAQLIDDATNGDKHAQAYIDRLNVYLAETGGELINYSAGQIVLVEGTPFDIPDEYDNPEDSIERL